MGVAQGGPVVSMAGLAEGALGQGCRVTVASIPRDADGPEISLSPGIAVELERNSRGGQFRWAPGLLKRLERRDFSIVHSHGLWTYASLAACRLANTLTIPHLLAPCGMLQPMALQVSGKKKRIAGWLFQDSVLRLASCLHAKSQAEYRSFRDYGLTNPVAVIPNPVQEAPAISEAEAASFRTQLGLPEGERQVLFLGRLHPVKGLERLLRAWAGLHRKSEAWGLLIAGPDEGGFKAQLKALLAELKPVQPVRFVGPLDDQAKWLAFRASDVFVMPSDFENFGSAIAESMKAGIPVIATTGSPWNRLVEDGCGWYVEPDVHSLQGALSDALSLTDAQRTAMGEACHRLAQAWSARSVTCRVIDVYSWLSGDSKQPDCVIIN